MTNAAKDNRKQKFGAFEVDVRAGELYKRGKKIKAQQQPMQVLTALLEKPGEVVTREELRTRIWPADTFVDFEHSLNTAVKKLRQALGDRAGKSKYIETLPKKGYRFLGAVESGEEQATLQDAPKPEGKSRLEGKVFAVRGEEGAACVVAPVDEKSLEEWERLRKLGDDVGISMMIAEKRLLLLEVGMNVRLLSAEGTKGCCEARILEGEHYGKTALVPQKSLRALAAGKKK